MKSSIRQEWEAFAAEHVPADPGEEQREATQIAFYHGAGVFLDLMMSVRKEQPVARLDAVASFHDELREYNQMLVDKYPGRSR